MTLEVELGARWSLEDLVAISEGGARLVFGAGARSRVERSRQWVESWSQAGDDAPNVYGINTGFGALAETRVKAEQMRALQRNLVLSHSCGVGEPFGAPVVRTMIALRAQTLALGYSGVRPVVIERLMQMLHGGVVPRIPQKGSVGASGDLAPLAHLASVLIGEGEAWFEGELLSGAEALGRAGLEPITLQAKEGLALINGTQMMLAVGGIALHRAEALCRMADIVGAMSLDALQGTGRPFDERIAAVRPHPGHAASAKNLRMLLAESEIMKSHADCGKVQDPYSLRCMPQIHGATRDTLAFVRQVCERETVSATDNPLIFVPDGEGEPEVISGGNFHGQPLAIAFDAATIAISEIANASERRIEQLVNPAMSSGLPPFLAPHTGLDSGFMMAQVTAAALVSENKVLAHPSSVDSIPSSAGKEDHVSMGSISARKFAQVVEHVRSVLAIEALVAAQGLDLRGLSAGRGVEAAKHAIRQRVSKLEGDRPLYRDMSAVESLIDAGTIENSVRAVVGDLS